jgi:hypothetical protein
MSTLKEKFGKFALSKAQERQIYGGHCPKHLSEDWCHSYWQSSCGDGCVTIDVAGVNACLNTCVKCNKCSSSVLRLGGK